jgi:hypothetical protein
MFDEHVHMCMQVCVIVDEEGTEAAAVTAWACEAIKHPASPPPPPPVIKLDR